jgi:hypothetical protein
MLQLITVNRVIVNLHSDTSHSINRLGKQKCEGGLPQLLLLLPPFAESPSQIQDLKITRRQTLICTLTLYIPAHSSNTDMTIDLLIQQRSQNSTPDECGF